MLITIRKEKASHILSSLHAFKSGLNAFGFNVCFNQN